MSEKQPTKTDKQSLQNVPFDCLDMMMNAPVGIFTSTPDGRFVDMNPAMARMFGYDSPQEMMNSIENMAVQLYADPKDRDEIQKFLEQHDKRLNYECRFIRKDSSLFWASNSVRAVRDEMGNVVFYQSFFSDITERKQMEEALFESETKYRTLIESSRDLIYITDNKGILTYANPTLEKTLGYEKGELNGQPFTQIAAPGYINTVRKYFSRAMKGETIPVYDAEVVRKDGTKIPMEFNTITLFDPYGKPSGRYGIGRDITEWKKEETKRRDYELRLASIIDFLPDATLVIDRDGRVIAWNRAIEEMTGVPAREMLGKGDHEYAVPFYGERRPILIDFVFTWRPEVEKEYSFINKKGDTLYTETAVPFVRGVNRVLWGKASPLYDSAGNVVGAIESIRDMTERKQSEEALRESEEKFRILAEATPTAVMLYQDDHYIYANKAAEMITGYSSEEILGMNFWEFIHHDYQEIVRERGRKRQQRKETTNHYELRVVTKDGKEKWGYLSGATAMIGGQSAGIISVVDITDRKRAEESLRESEEKYRFLTESMMDIVWTTDLNFNLTYVSPSVKKVLGFTPEERMHQNVEDTMTKESYDTALSLLARELEAERNGTIDPDRFTLVQTVYNHKEGHTVWMETMVRFIRNHEGNPIGIHGVSRDITERKHAEEEREKLKAQLNQAHKMEAIGTLAGGIAHDFNNLLMGIQGNTSLMMLEFDSSDLLYERLKQIEEQVKSGADLTRQLMGFARGGRYEMKPTDMNEIIEKTAVMFGRTKKEITIYKKYEKDLWAVEADRTQMGQVFMNLFMNAWQAMPGGGEIFLGTDNILLDEAKATGLSLSPGKYVRLSVTDTGTGMDANTLERIFDPFFTTKGMGRGTGLGLATAYGSVKGHGGVIHVTSKPGKGSTFEIYLPALEKAVVRETAAKTEALGGTETILLVDDEAMVLDVTSRMLQSLGYNVHCAGSGQEAMAIFHQKKIKIDLVVLDMIMPGISGNETFNCLRKIDPNMKVLLSSGYSIDGMARELIKKGCNGFLQKPFRMADLAREVRAILDSKKEY